jgi:hypothetical protein
MYEPHVQYYTGIGSRATPEKTLQLMEGIAIILSQRGYKLRSGGADGADNAFERGCILDGGEREIYLPWEGLNGRQPNAPYCIYPPTSKAFKLAAQYHPAWQRCSRAARLLHARNSHQILGKDCETRSKFVVCWHLNKGGTMQAIRIATDYDIDIYNLADVGIYEQLLGAIESL